MSSATNGNSYPECPNIVFVILKVPQQRKVKKCILGPRIMQGIPAGSIFPKANSIG